MDRFAPVMAEFSADIDRIENLLELIKGLRDFGACSPPEVEHANQWPEALGLWNQARARRTDLPILSGSLLLYLAGRFEFCMRQAIEVAAEEIAFSVSIYENLPDLLKTQIKIKTLEVAQNPARYGFDQKQSESFLVDLCIHLDGQYQPTRLPFQLIAITDSNLRSRALADLTKRVALENLWKELGKQSSLKLALEKTTDSETTAEAQSRLDALMDERNQIAHPTSTTTFPDPDKVRRAAGFLRVLTQAIIDLLRIHLRGHASSDIAIYNAVNSDV